MGLSMFAIFGLLGEMELGEMKVKVLINSLWLFLMVSVCFFFSSRRRHTRCSRDWSSDVCSSDLADAAPGIRARHVEVAQRRVAQRASARHVREHPFRHELGGAVGIDGGGRGALRGRSEERRVGKECRVRWARFGDKEVYTDKMVS